MTKEDAREAVIAHLKILGTSANIELALFNEHTMEKSFGWVFFYQSKRYVDTGDESYCLAGNGPIVVTRADGRLHTRGTAYPLHIILRQFEVEYGGVSRPPASSGSEVR